MTKKQIPAWKLHDHVDSTTVLIDCSYARAIDRLVLILVGSDGFRFLCLYVFRSKAAKGRR